MEEKIYTFTQSDLKMKCEAAFLIGITKMTVMNPDRMKSKEGFEEVISSMLSILMS